MSGQRVPFGPGVVILGGGALLLSAVLLLGFLLPTAWEASASRLVRASPEAVFGYLDSPEGWRSWTPWPDSGLIAAGPLSGTGAALTWDDPELGSGRWELVDVRPPQRVAYAVEVEGGAMLTHGTVSILPSTSDDGVLVTWRESGDLGRNPLMGFWAFFMSRAQTTELEKGLERLDELAATGPFRSSPAPTR
jgi:uncharacterized protein YndB with AHSA1/START domain